MSKAAHSIFQILASRTERSVCIATADRAIQRYDLRGDFSYSTRGEAPKLRLAYAAVHVVADPLSEPGPQGSAAIDWEATLAFRHDIWRYGLGVAEAMDTAQRGMGLDWAVAKELIARSCIEARAAGGRIVCGAQTDQLAPDASPALRDIEVAYEEQCELDRAVGRPGRIDGEPAPDADRPRR